MNGGDLQHLSVIVVLIPHQGWSGIVFNHGQHIKYTNPKTEFC